MAASRSLEMKELRFHEMGLDDRILKAIAKLGWSKPTLIQERAIPLALEGKDLLARARTGSGKTAAYAIPVIQRILSSKQTAREQAVRAVVMVPSRELCSQAHKNILELTSCCSREVKCADVSAQVDLAAQRPLLMEKPDVVVGTPSRLLAHLQAQNLTLMDSLEVLVVDEADLIFSFGYEADLKALLPFLPKIYQAFLMSATLSDEVVALKRLVLHNPITLKLEESQLPDMDQLTQYHVKCGEEDKFLLLYTLLKLRLVRGKTIIFVNDIDKSYRLKLFLEQFSIAGCVLNSELPVNSRCHIVEQFNAGLYDIIIASDESSLATGKRGPRQKKSKFKKGKSREYGVSRGIDFQNVANIINFDFPTTIKSYIHRVGRTARGDTKGTALSLVNDKELEILADVEKYLVKEDGSPLIRPYQFKMAEIEGFRYRCKDAMRAVTRVAVREARVKEIKQEIFHSKTLRTYFDDNPRDMQLLRHDRVLHPAKVHSDLRHVPEYLVPKTLKGGISGPTFGGPAKKRKHRGPRESRFAKKKRRNAEDPLKSFKFNKS
ncbi:probable ATP-dependent RNA helicase DDX56 [Acanthaster planci]|uniref:Probable ATP-dependent RNA helicase DDX56 n=1 Tax=Acanthaster planci TaxID=133434 RepID=A0A8B7XK71_ACAPL|nr:probable ATP-dependent RNA helicase DDX56 [Acanthaster planci]